MQKWKSSKIKLGLVIDLTNTTRFYDPEIFMSNNVKYQKLKLKGHGECPSINQTQSFITLVEEFLNMNPLSFVAVHCTHGFNRTGFLICAYLVERMDWSIDAALEAYDNIRPPGIYKQHYIDELYLRYEGSRDEARKCVDILPDWCFEDVIIDQVNNDDEEMEDTTEIPSIPEDELPGVDSRQKVFIDSPS